MVIKKQKAFKIIKDLLINHKDTHTQWIDYYKKYPKEEKKYGSSVGDTKFHKQVIRDYNKALKALQVLGL